MNDHAHIITPDHLTRAAVVYVRQSSPDQVRNHQESTRLQIGLREKAISMGWLTPSVIDDDLGISAGGFADRPGFRDLLTRVAMREVGIIICIDASRLSRNSKDWAHLFELCAHFHTLIADLEQVYDLARPNDRLVMGIKGTVSEMELTILRARLQGGVQAKAARGELRFNLPVGYVHDELERITFDPDQRVQQALQLMFSQFGRCSSVRQLAMWYRDTKTSFPVHPNGKAAATSWAVPASRTLYNLLLHPIFAGVYVFGRRTTCVEYVEGRLHKRSSEPAPVEQSRVCIRDHHPAYITWDCFVANRAKIVENRPRWNMRQNRCAIRDGLALLSGLLRCGQCGGKIYVSYKAASALYGCGGGHEKSARRCLAFGSSLIDQKVGEELCRVVTPYAVQAAMAAAEGKDAERLQQLETARLAVQAAQYEADRAFDQFNLCDPKNRLVADTLEARLNEKLATLQEAKAKLASGEQSDGPGLTDAQRRSLQALAQSLPQVWNHPSADPGLKKRLLRSAIHEILVRSIADAHELEVTIHWHGGVHTRLTIDRPIRRRGNKAPESLVDLVTQLAESLVDPEIARILNLKRIETPRGLHWTQDRVRDFRQQHRILIAKNPPSDQVLNFNQIKAYLQLSNNALMALVRRGAIATNQVTEFAPWRVPREQLHADQVQRLVRCLKTTGRLPKQRGCPDRQRQLFNAAPALRSEL